jgi:hypothetical protein
MYFVYGTSNVIRVNEQANHQSYLPGGYAVLFGTCMYLMRRQEQGRERQNRSLYFALTTILFALTSMFVVSYTMNVVRNSLVFFAVLQTGDIGPLKKYSTHDVGKTVLL